MERTHITTKEAARLFGVKPATVRRGLCVNGHYLWVQPVKLCNGRLLWPLEPIQHMLNGKAD